ncbi:hypothetical protein B0T13DRAFT_469556 [Neurospora crassa]|nr:hypothetical protein B0T13DRAFT_469556 [Neurospora crassa]
MYRHCSPLRSLFNFCLAWFAHLNLPLAPKESTVPRGLGQEFNCQSDHGTIVRCTSSTRPALRFSIIRFGRDWCTEADAMAASSILKGSLYQTRYMNTASHLPTNVVLKVFRTQMDET